MLGVIALGVIEGVCAPGVSSHRDLLLLAPGVGVSCMRSPPRSVLGVSAHPLPCPGVSVKNQLHVQCNNIVKSNYMYMYNTF